MPRRRRPPAGWLFPVGDEVSELGYVDMFSDMFGLDAIDGDTMPRETFYDGYVVNAIMDAAYRSAKAHAWEPVTLDWRGGSTSRITSTPETYAGQVVIKRWSAARRPSHAHPQAIHDGRLHRPRGRRVRRPAPDAGTSTVHEAAHRWAVEAP